jgi:hypothetical protein
VAMKRVKPDLRKAETKRRFLLWTEPHSL